MKNLIITALMVLAPAAWSASPFLPISATNTFRSGERAIVEQAIADAEAQGKLVLIDMSAAWCGPCLGLDKDMEAKKAALQPTLDHFVYIKLEEMHLEMMAGADFMAHEIPWFPSLYVYNPANQKWSWLYAFNADGLNQALKDYMANGGVSALYLNNLMTKIQKGVKVELDDVMQALIPMSVEDTGANLLAATAKINAAFKANPSQFVFSADELAEGMAEPYKRSMERGQTTIEAVRGADANAFKGLETDFPGAYRMYFIVPVGRMIRADGNKAASDKCQALMADTMARIAAATADMKRELQLRMEFQCLLLKVQLKESSGADVAAYAAALSATERDKFSFSLMRVYALTGTNFQEAITFAKPWKAAYEKGYAKNAELLARIIKATDERLAAYAAGKSHP